MLNFHNLYADKKLNEIINTVNEVNKNTFMTCHGKYHVEFVIKTIEYILQSFHFNEEAIELGKIAGLFHDIGCISGKKDHAKTSSEMCIQFLDKTNLTNKNKDIIIQAVSDLSNGNNISSTAGAALLIADKINVSKDRVLPLGYNDRWHRNLCEIEEMGITVSDNIITINYITTDKFSKNILLEEWHKGILIPIKASKYFNCTCKFMINGVETQFDLK